jgi:CcmD family protein
MTRTSRKTVWGARATLTMIALLLALGAAQPILAAQPPVAPQAQEGFVPVKDLPEQEKLPAAPLVMAAYAVAWVAVFGYIWSVWSRLGRVERDLAEVGRRVEKGARR